MTSRSTRLRGVWPLVTVSDRTGKSLREVSGTVAGWIRTPPAPLITIDNLAKSINVAKEGPEGSRVKVTVCQRDEDGFFNVKIELIRRGRRWSATC